MQKIIIYTFLISFFSSCNGSKDSAIINQEFGNLPTELIKKLNQISPKSQEFKIDPTKSNTVIGESGTLLLIPENVIVDQDNKLITSEVKIVLKENYSKSDFFLSNLQTVHNNQLLESGGMIYFNAYDANGNSLKIEKGKSIRVEFPNTDKIENPKVFIGQRDETGFINWGDMKEPNKSMVTYPILYISQHNLPEGYGTECPEYYGIVNTNVSKNDISYYLQDDILKYEKTILATKEFKMRYDTYCSPEIVKLYISNIDKNMWEIDQMMVDKFYKDSIREVNYYLNDERINLSKEQIEARKWLTQSTKDYYKSMLDQFRKFAAQKLEKVDTNLVADTAVFAKYIDSYESYNNVYKAKTAYDAIDFGWINLDVIYRDPNVVEMDINVVTNENPSNVTLILKDREVLINANAIDDNLFSFTKKINGYNKLPKGEKGILVAIGYKKNEVIFAMKEIVIGENEQESLNLKPISVGELKKKLEKINN